MKRLLRFAADVAPGERRAVALAFACNFLVLGSFYILRPVRDTVATVIGVNHLQTLFTATFVGTLIASPIYAALASRVKLSRLLPGVFWFWLLNVLLFAALFRLAPGNSWISGSYWVWFSVTNLFMTSVFWSLMVDLFSPMQATRLFALIAAGGELGAIAGPLLTRGLVRSVGLDGLLFAAALGLALVIVLLGIATDAGAIFLGGSPQLLLLRESLFTGAFGSAPVVTAGILPWTALKAWARSTK